MLAYFVWCKYGHWQFGEDNESMFQQWTWLSSYLQSFGVASSVKHIYLTNILLKWGRLKKKRPSSFVWIQTNYRGARAYHVSTACRNNLSLVLPLIFNAHQKSQSSTHFGARTTWPSHAFNDSVPTMYFCSATVRKTLNYPEIRPIPLLSCLPASIPAPWTKSEPWVWQKKVVGRYTYRAHPVRYTTRIRGAFVIQSSLETGGGNHPVTLLGSLGD